MATVASSAALPRWFKPVALLAIVWNAFGVAMYLSTVGVFGDPTVGMSEAEKAAASSIPAWAIGAFAIGTFGGLIGSIALLLRKSWAQPVLVVSLLALLVLEGWAVFLSGTVDRFSLVLAIVIVVVAIYLAWLATQARRRGWVS